ncbi:cupin domain-containing protein [Photobacterium makurazakiensis]|uniref:hypothetical protein n=1 Tax=Photobacterium makurazakiensis TaxID=2910234 RepID=UPI003D0F23A1
MKQAIDFSHNHQEFLNVGSRRKSINTFMFIVTKGCAFIRLGKDEFTVKAGHGFLIPIDCLHAITILPGTIYNKVEFSARLTSPICKEAGFFRKSPLVSVVLDELAKHYKRDGHVALAGTAGNLLRVLTDQVTALKVHTKSTSPELAAKYQPVLSKALKGDKVIDRAASDVLSQYTGYSMNELQTCILMREALKLSRSGRKTDQIAETLNVDAELLAAMARPILGQEL